MEFCFFYLQTCAVYKVFVADSRDRRDSCSPPTKILGCLVEDVGILDTSGAGGGYGTDGCDVVCLDGADYGVVRSEGSGSVRFITFGARFWV